MYAKIINGELIQYPYTWEDMRAQNPETLFPSEYVESIFIEYGAVAIAQTEEPPYDRLTHIGHEGMPALIDGVWSQTWVATELSTEQQAALETGLRETNRQQAKQALLDTDWCEMPSVRNTAIHPHLLNPEAFDAYRLTLRAIVVDPPVVVSTWPEKPNGEWSSAP